MTIFRVFMKLFSRSWKVLLIYLLIFVGAGTLMASSNAKTMEESFQDRRVTAVVVDHDGSQLSKALRDYLADTQNLVDLKTEDPRRLNDYVRAQLADYVVIIPQGFGEDPDKNKPQYISAGTSAAAALMTGKLNTFLADVKAYEAAGLSRQAAARKAVQALEKAAGARVEMLSSSNTASRGYYYYLFNFAAYGVLMMLCEAIGMTMAGLRGEEVSRRINISSYSFSRRTLETVLAILAAALLILVPFFIVCAAAGRGYSDTDKLGYYMLNLFLIMFPGIGLGYLISSISINGSLVSILSNSVVLAMCFISGVITPMEFLSPATRRLASFAPLYWFVKGNELIDRSTAAQILGSEFLANAGMQLLFAVILVAAGMIVSRVRERA